MIDAWEIAFIDTSCYESKHDSISKISDKHTNWLFIDVKVVRSPFIVIRLSYTSIVIFFYFNSKWYIMLLKGCLVYLLLIYEVHFSPNLTHGFLRVSLTNTHKFFSCTRNFANKHAQNKEKTVSARTRNFTNKMKKSLGQINSQKSPLVI